VHLVGFTIERHFGGGVLYRHFNIWDLLSSRLYIVIVTCSLVT
jgi:hypothetical protein